MNIYGVTNVQVSGLANSFDNLSGMCTVFYGGVLFLLVIDQTK